MVTARPNPYTFIINNNYSSSANIIKEELYKIIVQNFNSSLENILMFMEGVNPHTVIKDEIKEKYPNNGFSTIMLIHNGPTEENPDQEESCLIAIGFNELEEGLIWKKTTIIFEYNNIKYNCSLGAFGKENSYNAVVDKQIWYDFYNAATNGTQIEFKVSFSPETTNKTITINLDKNSIFNVSNEELNPSFVTTIYNNPLSELPTAILMTNPNNPEETAYSIGWAYDRWGSRMVTLNDIFTETTTIYAIAPWIERNVTYKLTVGQTKLIDSNDDEYVYGLFKPSLKQDNGWANNDSDTGNIEPTTFNSFSIWKIASYLNKGFPAIYTSYIQILDKNLELVSWTDVYIKIGTLDSIKIENYGDIGLLSKAEEEKLYRYLEANNGRTIDVIINPTTN